MAIFAGFDSKKIINIYVLYYLKELKKIADIIFVYDNEFSDFELKKIENITMHNICEFHGEYDFGSYKRGYQWAEKKKILRNYDNLILCNDSVFGPFSPLEDIFKKFDVKEEVDF